MSRELVDTKRELEAAKNDYTRIGWDVVERGLRGSWGGHILYFLCAPVYGNLIYSAYRRYDRPEQTVIRVREGDDAAPTRATTTVGNAGEGGVGEEV